jgi:predicted ATPase
VHNLPEQLTSFVGREKETAEVARLMNTSRMLTLTGSGGCGKTRLAVHVARALVETFEDGVWLVELAPLGDHARVPQAVISALGLRDLSSRPPSVALQEFLRARHALLILDNCEHLIVACAELAASLLRKCSRVSILATSRERLGIGGETEWRVPSLGAPPLHMATSGPGEQLPAADSLIQYDSVRLFFERAQAAHPAFELNRQTAQVAAQICVLLDGLPLAIELAAARVRHLPVVTIAARLSGRLTLLTGGSREVLPRLQTLRATLDWSYELLSEPERKVLCRLSVFTGPFSLEAAEAVCADTPMSAPFQADTVDSTEVVEVVARLIDKSLVVLESSTSYTTPPQGVKEVDFLFRPFSASAPYRLLETVRQYAAEQLDQLGESRERYRRHRDWYAGLAIYAKPRLQGPDQQAWLDRLHAEYENIRSALTLSERDPGGGQTLLEIAEALTIFWDIGMRVREGRLWLGRALAACRDAPAQLRARAMLGAGFLATRVYDRASAESAYTEALRLFREAGDDRGVVESLSSLSNPALERCDYATGRALLEESLGLAERLGDDLLVAQVRWHLGKPLVEQGHYDQARSSLQASLATYESVCDIGRQASVRNWLGAVDLAVGECTKARSHFALTLQLFQEARDVPGVAWSLFGLGLAALLRGDVGEARVYGEKALEIRRMLGVGHRALGETLGLLGSVERECGNMLSARARLGEGLQVHHRSGFKLGVAQCVEGIAGLASDAGQAGRAARLFGAAAKLRDTIGAPLRSSDRPIYERDVAAARVGVDAQTFATAWAEGQSMPLEQAIAVALSNELPGRPTPHPLYIDDP